MPASGVYTAFSNYYKPAFSRTSTNHRSARVICSLGSRFSKHVHFKSLTPKKKIKTPLEGITKDRCEPAMRGTELHVISQPCEDNATQYHMQAPAQQIHCPHALCSHTPCSHRGGLCITCICIPDVCALLIFSLKIYIASLYIAHVFVLYSHHGCLYLQCPCLHCVCIAGTCIYECLYCI